MKNRSLFILVVLAAAFALLVVGARQLYVVPVLTYHSISGATTEPLNTVSPERFREQMEIIQKSGYHVISAEELARGILQGRRFPHNTVVITFDDGYEDNYLAAYPVLKEFGLRATIFVPSIRMGSSGWLTTDQARLMSSEGLVTIGAHTKTHLYLPGLPVAQQEAEILESKKVIEEELGRPVILFAYPIGGFTEDIKAMVRRAGYLAAFTTNRGQDKFARDLFELKRIRIKDSDNAVLFRIKLSGYYDLFRSVKSGH